MEGILRVVGVMYGDTRVTPYGRAKEFFYMIRMEVRRDEWLGVEKERVGLTFKVRVTKNKTAPPHRMAALDFYWQDSEDHKGVKQLANIGTDLEIIEQAGAFYRFDGRQWRGKEAMFTGLAADPGLQHNLDRQIRKSVLLHLPETELPVVPRRRIKKT